LVALCVGGAEAAGSSAQPLQQTVTGGVHVYEAKNINQNIPLGSQANPTTVATKKVPAGKYLVSGQIGVNTQPGSFVVCALSNVQNGNDGVFGTFTNQWTLAAQENVHESEVLTIAAGQQIHLTCDDNNGNSGDVVGSAVIEAIPVNTLS
jgi:hypothetical protein